jgi:hypothetical protein
MFLERLYSFFERAANPRQMFIPAQWSGWGHGDLYTFYAAAKSRNEGSLKWIAKVDLQDSDVFMWDLHPAAETRPLVDLNIDLDGYFHAVGGWPAAVKAADQVARQSTLGVKKDSIELQEPQAPSDYASPVTYEDWVARLRGEQRAFIEAPITASIRLKGPAGSGKTLALELKAIRETRALLEHREPRVLFATHSWSLAEQVSDDLRRLDTEARAEKHIHVLPLLEVARELGPSEQTQNVNILGDDSEEGRVFQLIQLAEELRKFVAGDWITYVGSCSAEFREAIAAVTMWLGDEQGPAPTFLDDLLTEFVVVLGGEGIMDGPNDQRRYLSLARGPWSMPLPSEGDLRACYAIYRAFLRSLSSGSLITADQFLKDFLDYLKGFVWNSRRRSEGYDIVFVDELHLFNPLERGILNYLNRDSTVFPVLFMALDPRQSTTGRFGAGSVETIEAGDQTILELTEVYRFTPEVLEFVRHINRSLPTEDFGEEWHVDISRARSDLKSGPKPTILDGASMGGEQTAALSRAQDMLKQYQRVAIAFIDPRGIETLFDAGLTLRENTGANVVLVRTREDLGILSYSSRGLVIGAAADLAGLQFDAVVVVGLGDPMEFESKEYLRQRFLSSLYLAVSRARHSVSIVVDQDTYGVPDVVARAVDRGIVSSA